MGLFSRFKKDKEIKFKRRKNVKIGLALSGGATRGIGHIGAGFGWCHFFFIDLR